MSEARQAVIDADTARFAKEYGEVAPVEESDTEGTPEESMESEAEVDGALADSQSDEFEEDTEDGTPSEGELEDTDWEERYLETQKGYTEKSQELSKLRQEQSQAMAEITQMRFDLSDRMGEAEQVAQFWAQQAQGDLQRLQQVNPQQLNQEQYAQWQQAFSAAQQRAGQMNQALNQTKGQANAAREDAIKREAAVSRAYLERSIDNFQEVYPDIGKFAVDNGVNPKVWQEITDPGLVKILHDAMKGASQPDTIETVTKKTKAKKHQARNVKQRDEAGRFKAADKALREATNPRDRRAAYVEKQRLKLEREYGR